MFGAIGRGGHIYHTLTEGINKNLLISGIIFVQIHLNCLLCSLRLSHLCQRGGTAVPVRCHNCAKPLAQSVTSIVMPLRLLSARP